MKTIKDVQWKDWQELDFEEKLDVTINTMFIHSKINTEEKMSVGDFGGEALIELVCLEDDDKSALTEGWIEITENGGARIEINLWRGNGQPYFTDADMIFDTIFEYLEGLEV